DYKSFKAHSDPINKDLQTVQAGLRQAYECIASAPIIVIDSPYYSVYEELASPEQTDTGKDMSNPLYGSDGLPKTVRVFQFTLDSRSEKLDWFLLHQGVCFHQSINKPKSE
ncbi:hypothetical protein Tco_0188124, partial [Tanacetum coccineum]